MRRIFAYITGTFALLIVGASVVSALIYAINNNAETIVNLATSTIQGVGMAVGSIIGSAIVLRFKAARCFIKSFVEDVK